MKLGHVAAAGLAAAIALLPSAARADRPDAWITAKVKWQLLTDEHVKGTAVNVDTTDRRVTLHGRVASEEQRRRAADLAQGIEGVREVRNLLVIGPEESATNRTAEAARASDRELKERVSDVLDRDKALDDASIRVKSVNSGVVVLSGKAESSYDHQRAIRLAYGVSGVDRVASEITTPNEAADLEIWRAGKMDDDQARDTGAWDPMLTTQVKLKLLAADDVPGLDVNVDTMDGVVTLFGIVPTEESKRAAQAKAESVKGVVRVENELQVVSDANRESVQARDERLENVLEEKIGKEPALEGQKLDVDVRDGVARISGTVDAEYQHLAALVAARTSDGITGVVDGIQVNPDSRSAGKADD